MVVAVIILENPCGRPRLPGTNRDSRPITVQLRLAEVDVSTLQNFRHVCKFNKTCLVSERPSGLMHVAEPVAEAPVNCVFWGFQFYF